MRIDNMYNLSKFDFKKLREKFSTSFNKEKKFWEVFLIFVLGVLIGFGIFFFLFLYFPQSIQNFLHLDHFFQIFSPPSELKKGPVEAPKEEYQSLVSYEQRIIEVVKSASPSVVSIIVSKDLPIYERQWINPFGELFPEFSIPEYVPKGKKKQQVGAGTGFIVTEEGLVVTNKHVVIDENADYTIFTNDGEKYPAKVLALDPVQDLAVVKIQSDKKFVPLKLGDSDTLQIGQTVIAIGNALGEFTNTVSVGVVSGLQRTIFASGERGFSEVLQGIIQTDAAINSGNSGGPLLNLKGEVIGINTARVEGGENIGFAIPINMAKRAIKQVIENKKIVYPFLGVRYVMVDSSVKEEYKLSVDYGALIIKGSSNEPAILPNSAAQKAGLKEGDVILEVNGEKVNKKNPLYLLIMKYNPGDEIELKILRDNEEIILKATLQEREE